MKDKAYREEKPAVIIKATLDLIHAPGEVFEVRIPKTRSGTWSAYFKDTAIAAQLIARENGKHGAIYHTVNPIQEPLVARSENKFTVGQPPTTTDAEIERRRWFLLDFDPVRPAGISSTDGELVLSRERADTVRDWLRDLGWPEPIMALSGNGYHLMYRVDLENTPEVRTMVEFATKMVASVHSDERISVDTTVFNAARVWKVYGTWSKKGSDTSDRPHRVAMLVDVPRTLECVSLEQLSDLGRSLREANVNEYKLPTGEYISDMQKWLTDRGCTVIAGPKPLFGLEGQKWLLAHCPFNHQHGHPIVGLAANKPMYRCLHNSCAQYRWKEFREKIDPTYKDPETVYKRLKEWCESDLDTADTELVQAAAATGKRLSDIFKTLRKECPRPRVALLDDLIKSERRRFQREVLGNEHGEKGNVVGLLNRTRTLQQAGDVPMFWISEYDQRVRCGPVGDIDSRKASVSDEIALLVRFHSMGEVWVKQTHCFQVIQHLAEEYRVNPLKNYLKSFVWDGTPRIDTWLSTYLGTKDNLYTRSIGRKWLISAVARGMEPGCQADHMLILEGKQGIGKSRALRILGGPYYVEFSGIMKGGGTGHKDMVATILGKLIIEMSELATIKRADMESLKAILTTPVDDVRLSYERDAKSYPRTSVFAGTTNEVGQAYIADTSGARRFWPCVAGEVARLELERLKDERDQLWAEAVEAYEAGEDWWSVPTDIVAAEQTDRQMLVQMNEPWYDRVFRSLTDPEAHAAGIYTLIPIYKDGILQEKEFAVRATAFSTMMQILLGLDVSRQTTNDTMRMSRIMKEIGFIKVRPSKKWLGGSYAYDLHQNMLPHLWQAIATAAQSVKFKKPENPEESSGTGGEAPGATNQ